MNEKKSAAYCKLIENVKNKYRKNPIYTKNLTLGWCDLRQGEDLCQEINLWTYWQGRDYAKKTPHIKYMLIGQDFGPPEKEELKGTIANVRKMNDGVEVMFHKNVDLEARDSQTDKNIVRYFELLGKNEIDKKKYPDLFSCNRVSELIGTGEPYTYGETYIYPVAHMILSIGMVMFLNLMLNRLSKKAKTQIGICQKQTLMKKHLL